MTNRLKFLLIILLFVGHYILMSIHFGSLEHKLDIQMAEKEIEIYESINRNTNLINNLIKK